MAKRIDVLAVMDGAIRIIAPQSKECGDGADQQADAIRRSRAAVADLITAAIAVLDSERNSHRACEVSVEALNRLDAAIARIGQGGGDHG